jgi:hypothetical protein
MEHGQGGVSMIVGSGHFKYRVNAEWAKLPDGWSFKEVATVGVDSQDRVYVFNRGEHPMMVFDREGNFYGARRYDLPDRRWRPFRAQGHA